MSKIHFIAIGGAIMHQLALALQRSGDTVTGSDDEINDPARTNLEQAGILPAQQGWFPEKITVQTDAIVLGMHACADNPELQRALELKIPVYSFPEYIYKVSERKKRVVIAGSHGKTTVTSMVMHVLKARGVDFDYLVGARVPGFAHSVRLSDAPLIVLEGDEYPASVIERRPKIFFYHPDVAVLNGVAWDHVNIFPTYENYRSQFEHFLRMVQPGAKLFYNAEDPEVQNVVDSDGGALDAQPYRLPEYRYEDGRSIVQTEAGLVSLSVFGSHNLVNLQAARLVCAELGIGEQEFYAAVADFTGAARRLEKLFETPRVVAYRDFAHAPSKLAATLNAVREVYPDRALVACFELHTFSSLNETFLNEYAHSMDAPDRALVFFSRHALALKKLPDLEKAQVKAAFGREDLEVYDDAGALREQLENLLSKAEGKVCLLLMSSGTFDGIDWNSLASRG